MTASDDVSGTRGLSRSLSRYDALLAAIPLAFGLALAAGTLLPVEPRTALSVAGLVGALVLADGLFLNPPGAAGRGRA